MFRNIHIVPFDKTEGWIFFKFALYLLSTLLATGVLSIPENYWYIKKKMVSDFYPENDGRKITIDHF